MPGIDQVDVGIIKRENMVDPGVREQEKSGDKANQDKGKGKRVIGSIHLK
jgi:hypothetical protein